MQRYCCIDELRPSQDGREVLFRGWLVSDEPLASLVVECADGNFHAVRLGQARADVGAAFPQYPQAGQSGFSVWLPAVQGDTGFWWIQLASGEWHRSSLDHRLRSPQHALLDASTLRQAPPVLLASCAPEHDFEARVDRWFRRSPRMRLRIDLINKCNLRCIMCHYADEAYGRRPTKRMSLEEFKAYFEPIAPHVTEALLSCADEPLLSPVFPELLRYLAAEHPHVFTHFSTNATLLDEKLRRVIVETGVGRVMVSVDGVRRETFERVRTGAKFDRVIRNIQALHRLRDDAGVSHPEIQCNFVMMRSNLPEAVPYVEMARQLGATAVSFHHAVPVFKTDLKEDRLEFHPSFYNHYRPLIAAAAIKAGLTAYLPDAYSGAGEHDAAQDPVAGLEGFHQVLEGLAADPVDGLKPRLSSPPKPCGVSEEFPRVFCEMPFYELFVANQETVMPCPYQRRVSAPLTPGTSLLDVYFSKPFANLRRAMLTEEGDPGCQECPLVAKRLTTRPVS